VNHLQHIIPSDSPTVDNHPSMGSCRSQSAKSGSRRTRSQRTESNSSRREFLKYLGVSSAVAPFLWNLPEVGFANVVSGRRKQRLIVMFSPNGIVPKNFWPDEEGGDFKLKPILKPLEKYKDQMLIMNGVSNKIRGDGDSHMRGMGCLLTGIELFPGNIQGGSHTPAGWAKGLSIDQEIKNYLQKNPETRTRFGSLEFGVVVPNKADPWTRMVFAGPNQPIAPIDNPYDMFEKMYGKLNDQQTIKSILDPLKEELKSVKSSLGSQGRNLIEQHETFVREMEIEIQAGPREVNPKALPTIESGVKNENDNMPLLSRMQIELLVNSLQTDMTRVATLQFTRSVGGARLKSLGIEENHHALSHESDRDKDAQEKLTKIDTWFCEQLKYLVDKLATTPEADGSGMMLDNTTVVWTNELGQGNSHTLNNIPFVMVGGGLDFKMGRSLKYKKLAHNRLLISLAHAFGHHIESFGNKQHSHGGVISELS